MRKQAVIGAAVLALAVGSIGYVAASDGGERAGSGLSTQAGSAAGISGAAGERLRAVGLTADQRLVSFRPDRPGSVLPLGRVGGLKGDTELVGIDYRVQNGKLYGVGDRGGIYTIRETGAKATKVSQLGVALQGRSFGVDFNPAANRLRVISDTGQNLRHNIDDPAGAPAAGGTAVDGTLTNPPVPPATAGTTATGVTAAAYTNNDLSAATATTLFDLDTALDRVSVQSPANAGSLAPTGQLGVDLPSDSGFDISAANTGYAVTGSRAFRIDLLTGAATATGSFPQRYQVVDLAAVVR
ncbi:DUF4394 domain-containing protein [Streptomyces sp. P17]|uniref:DUF4394 domain-containing protein n=1 Tax=Streptomyces sp. P17 TaxID=3074716 RepID=UPI0028F3F73D|nr:DUF4394 domain-containing protein [Streptomyces sp. P17]MDT9698040.1 DUF4394 domain-containing protein [Streptomyces sp. P17]